MDSQSKIREKMGEDLQQMDDSELNPQSYPALKTMESIESMFSKIWIILFQRLSASWKCCHVSSAFVPWGLTKKAWAEHEGSLA